MFFFYKISFPSQTVHFGPYHVLHIMKAVVPADNLSYQERSFEHPTRRQIFANRVGRICKLNVTVRLSNQTLQDFFCPGQLKSDLVMSMKLILSNFMVKGLFFINCIEKNQNKAHFEECSSSHTSLRDGSRYQIG